VDELSEQPPVLGSPVDPPADVWANAIAGALESAADGGELAVLLPDADPEPPESAWADDFGTHEPTEAPDAVLTDEVDTPATGGELPDDPGFTP
jgi:hypothetical protein